MSHKTKHEEEVNPHALLRYAKSRRHPDAVGRLFDVYRNYLTLVARTQIDHRIGARFDASDIVQETFLDAHQGFADFKGMTEAELLAWLRKILIRNILDQVKFADAQKRDLRREESLDAGMERSSLQIIRALGKSSSTPSRQATNREQSVVIADALAQLSDEHREVVIQRNFFHRSFAEIAEEQGKTQGAIRMMWLRALENLKQKMG